MSKGQNDSLVLYFRVILVDPCHVACDNVRKWVTITVLKFLEHSISSFHLCLFFRLLSCCVTFLNLKWLCEMAETLSKLMSDTA